MRKSEHTEIATLSRLAVLASTEGLSNITYGSAAIAAHLSRGAMQRLFPDKAALQTTVLAHAVKLMHAHTFEYDHIESVCFAKTRARWADWISGDAGLPGGCVLLATAAGRGNGLELQQGVSDGVERLVDRLSALAIEENIIQSSDIARFKRQQLAAALELHVAQFVFPRSNIQSQYALKANSEAHRQRKIEFARWHRQS